MDDNEPRFRDEKRALMESMGSSSSPHQATPHNCRCWSERPQLHDCVADQEKRIRRARVSVGVCALATMALWAFIGIDGGYFGDGDLQSIAWVWGGGGDAVGFPQQTDLGDENEGRKMWNDFSKIKPSEDLDWKPCYDKFLCARLSVPLDYSRPDGPKAAVAMVKLPAKNPSKNQPSILINPGGPGGSGTFFALAAAESIQLVAGDYPIIGFDPRGINNTTPGPVDCFSSCSLARDKMQLRFMEEIGNISAATLPTAWARIHGFGNLCNNAVGGQDDIGPHVSTPVVARDMLSIVDAEQREFGSDKEGKLWYWGFSYGSILGQTYATMFPDRVGRLIVDGVCDLPDYYRSDWKLNLMDADYVMDQFFELCFKAGPQICGFYTGSSPADIRTRLTKLMTSLNERPLVIYSNTSADSEIITGNDLRQTISMILYRPLGGFEILSMILVALEERIEEAFSQAPIVNMDTCSCKTYVPVPSVDAQAAILCSDGEEVSDTMNEFLEYKDYLLNQSAAMGNFLSRVRLMCTNYRVKAKWKFQGLPPNGQQVKTSHPLLFIGNIGDPVTPVHNAHTMSKRFQGASVLVQNSLGHCSLSSPSFCSFGHIRNYFDAGVLPQMNTTCEVELLPFLGPREGAVSMSMEQEVIVKKVRQVSGHIPQLGTSFGSKLLF